jgi:YggT family protein
MISIISIAFEILTYIIFIKVILSWFPHNPYQPAIRLIYQISNSILSPIRNTVSPIGGIDISPIIAIFIIQLIKNIILNSLFA